MTIPARAKGDPLVAVFFFCATGLLLSIGLMTTASVLDPTTYVEE